MKDAVDLDVPLKQRVNVGSVSTDPHNAWVHDVFHVMAPVVKKRPVPRGATCFTDASLLTPALGNPPTLILGASETAMAHETDEFCYVSDTAAAAQAYMDIPGRR